MIAFARAHPILVTAFVGGTAFGALAGVYLFEPDTWSLGRRLLAGAMMGAISVLILSASRIIAPADD